MATHYRKAEILEDGVSIEFYVDGKPWRGAPSPFGGWIAVAPDGSPGHGRSLWDAVEDAQNFMRDMIQAGAGS